MSHAVTLVAFANEAAARLLVNYLQSKDIKSKYLFDDSDPEDNAYAHQAVLLDPSQFDEAKRL